MLVSSLVIRLPFRCRVVEGLTDSRVQRAMICDACAVICASLGGCRCPWPRSSRRLKPAGSGDGRRRYQYPQALPDVA